MKKNEVVEAAKDTSCHMKDQKNIHELLLQTIRCIKEVSLSASMTLEASVALPLFIFFFINVLSIINIIKLQSDLEAALHQTGNDVVQMAYDIKLGEDILLDDDDNAGDIIAGMGLRFYAEKAVKDYLGDSVEKSNVSGGKSGLNFWNSKVMVDNDIVDIVVDYKVKPIVPLIAFSGFPVESRYYGHAWTGYDISEGAGIENPEEEMVYVTEHGTVYHRDIGCKHLKLSITSVPFKDIPGKRNTDGSKYYACEYCGKKASGGNVFITNYGNRYHTSVSCPGLKRKIYTIPLSEVGGRGPCSACGH